MKEPTREVVYEAVQEAGTGVGHLESKVIHDGRVVHLSLDRVRFPDGTEGELEFIRHRGASAVVPILEGQGPENREVVLIHQYRYAAGGYVYEIPAGIPFDQESWESCAARELEEETGFVPGDLEPLTRIFTTPGFTNEEIHIFLARGLKKGSVQRDEDEFMEVVTVPFQRAVELAEGGIIRDAKSLVGILMADRLLADSSPIADVHGSSPGTS